jgi:hypothetical protein
VPIYVGIPEEKVLPIGNKQQKKIKSEQQYAKEQQYLLHLWASRCIIYVGGIVGLRRNLQMGC